MKTIEIKIEERNRENHNYKIIKKLTTEVEITNEVETYFKKIKKEVETKLNFKHFLVINYKHKMNIIYQKYNY